MVHALTIMLLLPMRNYKFYIVFVIRLLYAGVFLRHKTRRTRNDRRQPDGDQTATRQTREKDASARKKQLVARCSLLSRRTPSVAGGGDGLCRPFLSRQRQSQKRPHAGGEPARRAAGVEAPSGERART